MIFVVARSEKHGAKFLDNHQSLKGDINLCLNTKSYFDLINALIYDIRHDYVCLVHDDVFLPSGFKSRLSECITDLNENWNGWGLAGNAGVGDVYIGYAGSKVVRYISDPHAGINLVGVTMPVMSIDGNVMLLNTRVLRERKVQLPDFSGFQLYDITLSLEVLKKNLGVIVTPYLACVHKSGGSQAQFDAAKNSLSYREYLSTTILNKYLVTLNGPIETGAFNFEGKRRFDPNERYLSGFQQPCHQRKRVAIVVRTQFKRAAFLKRALSSIDSFIASAGTTVAFEVVLITDQQNALEEFRARKIIHVTVESGIDSRFLLVQGAIDNIVADYFWFVDDDDWLFPNCSEYVAQVISSAPKNSMIFVDSQHFIEKVEGDDISMLPKSIPARRFYGRDFRLSLSGSNYSPFSSVLFPISALKEIPQHAFSKIVYYEDYFVILRSLIRGIYLPIAIDRLVVGISFRDSGSTVGLKDRTIWDQSMAEFVSIMATDNSLGGLVSFGSSVARIEVGGGEINELRNQLVELKKSWSWRITRPLRNAMNLARFIRGGSA